MGSSNLLIWLMTSIPTTSRLKSSLFPFVKHCRCFFESRQITNWQTLLEKRFCNLISANCTTLLLLTRRAQRSMSKWLTKSLLQTDLSDCSSRWKGGAHDVAEEIEPVSLARHSPPPPSKQRESLYCICIPGMSGSAGLSDRLKGGKFPIQEIVNQWYQSSNEVNHLGNFEIITWKLGTLYIVLLSFRDATTYRGGDDAEFAIMKFSVTSKSNPNIYVWSRSQVQKESLLHCCNHWEENDLLTASILSFYLLPFPLISATAVLEGPR